MKTFAGRHVFWVVAIALASLAIEVTAQGQPVSSSTSMKKSKAPIQVPNDLRFEPTWRARGDCGPLALYVLMRLHDRQVTIADVKVVVPFDADAGCSLADLARGADALGFPTEIRFVNPRDVHDLPYPFILHSEGSLERGIGHFDLVVDYSPEERKYHVIDTTFEMLGRVPEESILKRFTGYVLLPKKSIITERTHLLSLTLVCLGSVLAAITLFLYPFRKNKTAAETATLSTHKGVNA